MNAPRPGEAWLALLLAASALAPAAASAAHAKLVLVSIDGLPAGAERLAERVPARLAGGTSFGDVCAGASAPFPAWAELLTGCGPGRTLVRDEIGHGLGAASPTLAASLGALGYRGLALPCDALAHAGSGLARGFERYAPDAPALTDSARVDSALAWVRAPGSRFVWLALSYGASAEAWRRGDRIGPPDAAGFAVRGSELDSALARLSSGLARAGLADSTVLVCCGTAAVPGGPARVPVLVEGVAGPPVLRGRFAFASLADVAPTMLVVAGGSPAGFDGHDLLSPAAVAPGAGRACAPPPPVADPMSVPDSCAAGLFALLSRSAGAVDTLALAAWDSLAAHCPGSARVALERDVAWSRAGNEPVAARGLKAVTAAYPDDPRPALAYAEHLLRHGRPELVSDALKGVARDDPFAAVALWRLALAFAAQEDFAAAEGTARRAAALAVPTDAALRTPAVLHALGMLADSVAHATRDAALRERYGRALGGFGSYKAAYSQFHAARALALSSPEPDYWLAFYLELQGRPQHAVPALQRALERQPGYLPARLALSDALLELGRRKEARAQLEKAGRDPGMDARSLYNLACLRATDGERAAALDALERAVAAGYADRAGLAADHDLDVLRAEPRFRRLLEQLDR